MLLFRSEEAIESWASRSGDSRGESVPLMTVWELGRIWYRDRLEDEFRGLSADRIRATFAQLGLTSEFWHVP